MANRVAEARSAHEKLVQGAFRFLFCRRPDLGVRAHKLLEGAAGRSLPVKLDIVKRIPVGGGLGGGSSDAAAVLISLNKLFSLGMTTEALSAAGATLGSDVAFFIDNASPPAPAFVGGFGDEIERIPHLGAELILIIPPFSCATPAVYAAFDVELADRVKLKRLDYGPTYQPPTDRDELVKKRISKAHHVRDVRDQLLMNDLYLPALKVEPRLGQLATRLGNMTRHDVHMTGSGSCLFLITDQHRADTLMEKVARANDPEEPFVAMRTKLVG